MSVLGNYVERLERSVDRNQTILNNDLREFEEICQGAVEVGDTTLLRQADKLYKRAQARFRETEQVVQVLKGPRYRGLTHTVPQRESVLLTLQARYHQAFALVERARRAEPTQEVQEPRPGVSLFRATHKAQALERMLSADEDGEEASMPVSFIVIKGDPRTMRTVSVEEIGMRKGDLIERFDETEVRVAMRHPAILSHEVIETAVRERILKVEGTQIRAAIYRLSSVADLTAPFLTAIHLNLPRVPNRNVLTLNPIFTPVKA